MLPLIRFKLNKIFCVNRLKIQTSKEFFDSFLDNVLEHLLVSNRLSYEHFVRLLVELPLVNIF